MYLKREDTLADMDPKKSRGKWKSLFKKQTALNNIGLTRAITSKIKSQIKEEEAMEQQQQAGEAATKEQPPNQEKQILEKSPNSSSIEKKTHFEDNGDNLEDNDDESTYKAIEILNEAGFESYFKGPITALMLIDARIAITFCYRTK